MNTSTGNTTTPSPPTATIFPCTLHYPDINDVTRYVFGSSFILCALLATIGNTISLVILNKPPMRTKSNRFLTSLAVSDSLVGFLLCPLTAATLLDGRFLTRCDLESAKVFISVMLCGTSASTVALVAYDRYVLLSSLQNYPCKMSDRKVRVLILSSWLVPVVLQAFYVVHGLLYLLSISVLTVGPFVIISISYRLMMKKIRQKEEELASHQHKGSSRQNTKTDKKERKNLNLAHKLVSLIVYYVICLLPALFNFLAEITIRVLKKEKPVSLQTLTVFALFCASVNSVINPAIYVSKYPEFKREFWKLFGFGRRFVRGRSSMSTVQPSRISRTSLM